MGVSWGYCDGVNDLLEGDIYFHINHTFKLQLVLCSLGKQVVTAADWGQDRNSIPNVGTLVIKAMLKWLSDRCKDC